MRSESDPMHAFQRRNGELYVEDIPLKQLAERFGTPLYVYSRAAFTERYLAYAQALGDHPGMICYAVKANSNLAVLDLLARLGAGFDIVSGGELERVLRAGGDPERIVFSGVGKTREEMTRALDVGISSRVFPTPENTIRFGSPPARIVFSGVGKTR